MVDGVLAGGADGADWAVRIVVEGKGIDVVSHWVVAVNALDGDFEAALALVVGGWEGGAGLERWSWGGGGRVEEGDE